MWFLMALLGAVAASSAINLTPSNTGDEGGVNMGGGSAAAEDDDVQAGEGELIEHAERDPWLDGWTEDDEFVSSDAADPETPPPVADGMPFMLAENEPGAERDPWLDGWKDDEFISTDAGGGDDPVPGDPDPEPVATALRADPAALLRGAAGGGAFRL